MGMQWQQPPPPLPPPPTKRAWLPAAIIGAAIVAAVMPGVPTPSHTVRQARVLEGGAGSPPVPPPLPIQSDM